MGQHLCKSPPTQLPAFYLVPVEQTDEFLVEMEVNVEMSNCQKAAIMNGVEHNSNDKDPLLIMFDPTAVSCYLYAFCFPYFPILIKKIEWLWKKNYVALLKVPNDEIFKNIMQGARDDDEERADSLRKTGTT